MIPQSPSPLVTSLPSLAVRREYGAAADLTTMRVFMSNRPVMTLFDVGGDWPFFDGYSLSVLALRNFLERCGLEVNLRSARGKGAGDEPTAETVSRLFSGGRENIGDVVGLSCTSDYLPQALYLARAAKDLTGAFILLGGVGPTLLPEEILAAYPFMDAVCVGEGEHTLQQFLQTDRDPESLARVPGLVFRSREGGVAWSAPRPRIASLDDLPITHSVMELEDDALGYDVMVHLLTSRGCPGACSFCGHRAVWGGRRSTLSMDALGDFLQEHDYQGDRTLMVFHDDTFLFPPGRLKAWARALRERDLSVRWAPFARIADIGRDTAPLLRDIGCDQVTFGVDGLSKEILAGMRKVTGMADAKRAVAALLDVGVAVRVNLIWDWPGETFEDFEALVHFAYESVCLGALAGLSRLQVYPRTRLISQIGTGMVMDEAALRALPLFLGEGAAFVRENPALYPNFFRHAYSRDTEKKIDLFEKMGFIFGGDRTRQTRHPVRWTSRREYAS